MTGHGRMVRGEQLRTGPSRRGIVMLGALFVTVTVVAAACSGASEEASPRDDDAVASAETDPADSGAAADVEGGADADGEGGSSGLPVDGEVVQVITPTVPAIVLPDLSVLSERGEVLESRLGGLVGPIDGIDVVSASCVAQGGELVYQGSDGNSFFDIGQDGSGSYREAGIEVEVAADGSGVYRDRGDNRDIEITVEADGSGTYRDRSFGADLQIEVAADGSGTYRDRSHNNDLEIVINGDGSGLHRDLSNGNIVEIDVAADGSGLYREVRGNSDVEFQLSSAGSWSFRVLSYSDVELVVNADGSGTYRQLGSDLDLTIEVDRDGQGTYHEAIYETQAEFATEHGILDPDLLLVDRRPQFVVADRFPPLDTLGRLRPPCATVVRLGADVLFDFDSAEIRPEVEPVVDQLAEALIETDRAIEIHGHTDATGEESYNQDLAARRAEAFAAELVARGVGAEIATISFGESRPLAPNEKADGSDNPAGRQLNRRIEVVFPE